MGSPPQVSAGEIQPGIYQYAITQDIGQNMLSAMNNMTNATYTGAAASVANTLITAGFSFGAQKIVTEAWRDVEMRRAEVAERLGLAQVNLQETLADYSYKIAKENIKLQKDIAELSADVKKYEAKMDAKKSIANTQTMARYGLMNTYFYGSPARV
jgi:alpha/beta superfamily hydrolase